MAQLILVSDSQTTKTVPIARHLPSYGLDWAISRGDFHDVVASDVRLLETGNDNWRNRDWRDGMAIEMDQALNQVSASGRHSEVRVLTDTIDGEGIIDFRSR